MARPLRLRHGFAIAWAVLLACQSEAAPYPPQEAGQASSAAVVEAPPSNDTPALGGALSAEQSAILHDWYRAVGQRREGESFGALIVRAAELQLGKPYVNAPQQVEAEHLRVALNTFECVTFVESALGLARCIWSGDPTEPCFMREVMLSRYRDGTIDGYASRLHYFTDWLGDNTARGRLKMLSSDLGGSPTRFAFSFMTQRPHLYPALKDPAVHAQLRAVEARLTQTGVVLVGREQVAAAQEQLEPGDLVAFVGNKPGLLVTHAGFVHRAADGVPRILHASSYHKKVLLGSSIASYVLRKPERRGVLLARPLPPSTILSQAREP